MPVQINELVVKGVVDNGEANTKEIKKAAKPSEDVSGKLSFSVRKQIIDQCTEEVLERLRKMSEF